MTNRYLVSESHKDSQNRYERCYYVSSWKAYKKEAKWWFVNVEVSDCDSEKTFEFIYHDEPDEKLIEVCSIRALRAFCLHQLDDLNNPFDPNNAKYFPKNPTAIKVVEEDESLEEKEMA